MKLLASDPIYIQQFEAIDAESGIIKGVKVCSEGDAKGHGVFLNKQFIRDVVSQGKEQTVGVKARFGHPNMCDTTLGTYIGRFKRFRTVGEEDENYEELGKPRKSGNRLHAIADLHFDDTSENLPKLGNVKEYLLSLADSSPDMFGSSIVFKMGEMLVNKWKDEDGKEHRRNDATIESLLATDLVDSPAATDGLFSEFSTDEMAIQVTAFLDQHPEVYELAVDNPDILDMFMGKYADYKAKKESNTKKSNDMSDDKKTLKEMFADFKTEIMDGVKSLLGKDELPEEITTKLTEFEDRITKAEGAADHSALDEQVSSLTAELETANNTISEKQTEITNLTTANNGLEGKLTKKNATSTKTKAPEGLENPDSPDNSELASLNKDAAKIRAEMMIPHSDEHEDEDGDKD